MKVYRLYLVLLISLLGSKISYSRTTLTPDSTSWITSSYKWLEHAFTYSDTAYIKQSPQKYTLVVRNITWFDTYDIVLPRKSTIGLRSNLSYNMGFTFGYKLFLVSYSFKLSHAFTHKLVESNDWNLHIASNLIGFELYHIRNSGNTKIYKYQVKNKVEKKDLSFDGFNNKILGINIYYFFNHLRYSNPAAYSDGHRSLQHKSSGSLIAGVSYTRQRLALDFAKLAAQMQLSDLSDIENQNTTYSTYCISIGYGYNYVFFKKWMANLTGIPSFGIRIGHDETDNSTNTFFAMNNIAKLAVLYNRPRCFGGLNFQYNTNFFFAKEYFLTSSLGTFNLFFGVRF